MVIPYPFKICANWTYDMFTFLDPRWRGMAFQRQFHHCQTLNMISMQCSLCIHVYFFGLPVASHGFLLLSFCVWYLPWMMREVCRSYCSDRRKDRHTCWVMKCLGFIATATAGCFNGWGLRSSPCSLKPGSKQRQNHGTGSNRYRCVYKSYTHNFYILDMHFRS